MPIFRGTLIVVLVLIVGSVLGLWWAGCAPCPTEPVLLAGYNTGDRCKVQDDNWARCYPDKSHPNGAMSDFRLFPDASKKGEYGPYNSWGVEGFNGCWDETCREIWQSP